MQSHVSARGRCATLLPVTAVLVLWSSVAAQDPVVSPPASTPAALAKVVGVVDIERAIKAYPKARQLFDGLKTAKAAAEASMREQNEAAEKLKLERDGYDFLTSEWITANSQWEAARAALDARFNAEQDRFKAEKDRIEAQCLKDLDRAITELAAKKGLLLVLRSWPLEQDASITRALGRGTYGDVLYHDPALDMTEDVIKLLMSAAYSGDVAPANGGAAAPGSGK